jgi:hypothetical protein
MKYKGFIDDYDQHERSIDEGTIKVSCIILDKIDSNYEIYTKNIENVMIINIKSCKTS